MPDELTPEEQGEADALYGDPDLIAGAQKALDREALAFMHLAAECSAAILHFDNVWQARRAMADAALGLRELRGKLAKELAAKRVRPAPRGRRGGVG